jgi:hypothetical protein
MRTFCRVIESTLVCPNVACPRESLCSVDVSTRVYSWLSCGVDKYGCDYKQRVPCTLFSSHCRLLKVAVALSFVDWITFGRQLCRVKHTVTLYKLSSHDPGLRIAIRFSTWFRSEFKLVILPPVLSWGDNAACTWLKKTGQFLENINTRGC